jgi:hypothetical protein
MKRRQKEERSKFTALENHFLNTYFSGLYLSQSDLIAIGKSVGIPMVMNSREMLIKQLLNESDSAGTITQTMQQLGMLIDTRIQEYQRLSLDYPNSRDIMAKLAQKATGTKSLLARESRGNPYE